MTAEYVGNEEMRKWENEKMRRELVAHANKGTRGCELYEYFYYLVFETTDSSVAISVFARSLPI